MEAASTTHFKKTGSAQVLKTTIGALCGAVASRGAASSRSDSTREIELLRQQLSLKDALLDSKDALLISKDEQLNELRESRTAEQDINKEIDQVAEIALAPKLDELASHTHDLFARQAQKLAPTVVRVQRQEASSSSGISKSVDGSTTSSSSSSSSSTTSSSSSGLGPVLQLQKRACSSMQLVEALDKDEVLDEIFSFVGRKEWLFVGAVCRRWRGRYLSMCYKARSNKAEHAFQTSHSSAFVTAARFSLALKNGLTMPDESAAREFFDDLPKLSQQPIELLTLARVRGAA
jgi:hypothetical protein